jgi:hypothetical protein
VDCPFCTKEISNHAVACPFCGRDVSFLVMRAILSQQEGIVARLAAVEAAIHELGSHVEASGHAAKPQKRWVTAGAMVAWLALPVLLLVFAHWTIVGLLDMDTRALRAISIAIPLAFGLRYTHSLTAILWTGILIGVASVSGMLATTALIDHVPFMPQGSREWVETIQYFASIALAYLASGMIGRRIKMRQHPSKAMGSLTRELATILANSSAGPLESRADIHRRIATIAGWIYAVMTGTTAMAAVGAALSKFYS